MTDYTKMYAEKLTTADELAARVESGWSIGMDTSVSAAPANSLRDSPPARPTARWTDDRADDTRRLPLRVLCRRVPARKR